MMAEFSVDFREHVDINLGVGYVNEKTIPSQTIHRALAEVIARADQYRRAFNYGNSAGSENLIRSIRDYLVRHSVGGLSETDLADKRIIIGPNGATSLLESIAHVVSKGIVVTSDPMYYIYTNFLERAGFELLAIEEDREGPRIDRLERGLEQLGKRIKAIRFIYLVTVNNPSCVVLSNRRRREIMGCAHALCRRIGRNVPVIFDRAYEDLVHDPSVEPIESALRYDTHGIAYEVSTLSKVFAPGLRIGYLLGQDGAFMRALVQRTSDAGFSASMITQEISSWLLDHEVADQKKRVCEQYRVKAVAVSQWLSELLGNEIEAQSGGQAGFYFYLTFKTVETHAQSRFFRFLTRTTGDPAIDGQEGAKKPRVLYLPGEHCIYPDGPLAQIGRRQLRLSYGFEELDAIRTAIVLMREAIEYACAPSPQ
jgi:2-aminoadipate transaminase